MMDGWQNQLKNLKDPEQKQEELKMIQFYLDNDKTKLNPDFLSTKAQKWADIFFPDTQNKSSKKNLSSAQIRRFYGEVLSIEEKIKVMKDFDVVLPQIKMIKSKAAYAANPSNRKIPNSFKNFLFEMIDSINDEKDFKAFKLTFEAIVGYFYGKGAK